ncbi:MAG: cytochrome c [Gammaproteobacteria bacterium]|nr:cytochrome c [Gammaproteobacteria bacterium]
MKSLKVVVPLLAIAAILMVGFAYSGLYDVSASAPHSGIVDWLLSTTSDASVKRRAKGILVPDLGDDAMALAGVNDFDAMCTGCHGAPGQEPEAIGQGLNPSAPDLAEAAIELTPAELFWVTKHGIKMTGMPAWGATHDDNALWPMVAFMTMLPEMDAEDYQAMLARAGGMGHHAAADDDAGHENVDAVLDDHSTHPHDPPEVAISQEPEEDHSDHQH